MEFPFGNQTHHHHRRDSDDEDRRERPQPPPYYSQPPPPSFGHPPPPTPPFYQQNEYAPPPPPPNYYQENEFSSPPPPPRPYHQESHASHVHHQSSDYQPEGFNSFKYQQQPPPPPQPTSHVTHVFHSSDDNKPEGFGSFNYQQPPPPHVTHVSHEKTDTGHHHSFEPHVPSFIHHQSHSGPGSAAVAALSGRPTVRFFCKAQTNFSLSIRDGKVILAPSDPSDQFQHWYKDMKFSTRVKDEEGFPCFALVNKATGQAMKHSIGACHPVQLIPYNPDVLDESVLWTESKDIGDGYRAVRMVNNIRLNVDAFRDSNSGEIYDGATVGLWEWKKGDNQRWRIVPY